VLRFVIYLGMLLFSDLWISMKMVNIRKTMWKAVPVTPTTNGYSLVTLHLRRVSIRISSVRMAFQGRVWKR